MGPARFEPAHLPDNLLTSLDWRRRRRRRNYRAELGLVDRLLGRLGLFRCKENAMKLILSSLTITSVTAGLALVCGLLVTTPVPLNASMSHAIRGSGAEVCAVQGVLCPVCTGNGCGITNGGTCQPSVLGASGCGMTAVIRQKCVPLAGGMGCMPMTCGASMSPTACPPPGAGGTCTPGTCAAGGGVDCKNCKR